MPLGWVAPDFELESTAAPIPFHEWLARSWGIFSSHVTPVCATKAAHAPPARTDTCNVQPPAVDPLDGRRRWNTQEG